MAFIMQITSLLLSAENRLCIISFHNLQGQAALRSPLKCPYYTALTGGKKVV